MQGTMRIDCVGKKSDVQALAQRLGCTCSKSVNTNGDYQLTKRVQSAVGRQALVSTLMAAGLGFEPEGFEFVPYKSQSNSFRS